MTNSPKPVKKTPSHAAKKRNRLQIPSIHPPKPVKKTPSRAAKKAAQAIVTPPQQKNVSKRRNVITIAAIALVVAIVAGVGFYLITIMPMQRVILTVGNDNVQTGYFLKRVVANASDISSTLQVIIAELIIDQQSSAMGIAPVLPQDIDTYLRNEAKGTNDTITDAEFNTWFNEQLANTGLSAKDYREVTGREIQQQRFTDILSANLQSVVPQAHLWAIVQSTNDAALSAKTRIDGGEDFAVVAKDVSIVSTAKTDGGDLGWMPFGVIDSQLEPTVEALDIGKCSDPVAYVQSSSTSSSGTITNYVLLMVSEKSAAMQVTDTQLSTLKSKALNNWLSTQSSITEITFHGLNGSTTLDTQTSAWLNYQAQKLVKKRPSTETTTPTTAETTTTTLSTTTNSSTSP